MFRDSHHWALVLAAGEGTRLRALTTDNWGQPVPKQFCSLRGGPTLLQETVARATRVVPRRSVTAVVAASHRRWWGRQLRELSARNVIAQPANRGTAVGVLLPLLHILERDPQARVVLLPSDHFIANEAVLEDAVRQGLRLTDTDPDAVLLLGIAPEEADPELGYVVIGRRAQAGSFHVARFVEKPSALVARSLMGLGALWNSFILIARASALHALLRARLGETAERMQTTLAATGYEPLPTPELEALYADLPEVDLSRQVLEGSELQLRVLPVRRCGWNDLGNPRRLAACLHRHPVRPEPFSADLLLQAGAHFAQINLAEAHARLQPAA